DFFKNVCPQICFDLNFVDFFVDFLSTRSVTQFHLHKFKLDKNFGSDGTAKFISATLKAKFAVIHANRLHPSLAFNEQFMREYSNSVAFPILTIGYDQLLQSQWPQIFAPTKDLLIIFSRDS
ncbi:hypothetical protein PMAYCL1PPCAC_24703, partial [Pristionchus mayeri]